MSTAPSGDTSAIAQHLDESAAKQLFFGNILDEHLFPYPQIRERDRERLGAMNDAIDQFLKDKHYDLAQYDRNAEQPEEFIQALSDMGLFGLIIPEGYGASHDPRNQESFNGLMTAEEHASRR